MQTFLPYADFAHSAKVLDWRRLGKQRSENKIILNTNLGKPSIWKYHPAVKMWKGYDEALKMYYNFILIEWIGRGYKNNMPFLTVKLAKLVLPHWLGDKKFHESHRSNLLRKDFNWYSQFGWWEPDNLPYVWPVR